MKWLASAYLWIKAGTHQLANSLAALWPISRRGLYRARRVEDLPDRLARSTVYLVGEGEHVWQAALLCPCGCRDLIQLNLLPQTRPRWRYEEHAGRVVTLDPSVWRQRGCRSHFVLRHGRVRWC
jgi:hypothetical protein